MDSQSRNTQRTPLSAQSRTMMRGGGRRSILCAVLIMLQATPLPVLQAADFPFSFGRTSPLVRLAREIDRIEKEIDRYGSVTAKHPDVWSEERLTQHRFEYEQEMALRLDKFAGTINAQLRRSDQAFLATATAITSIVNQAGDGSGNGAQNGSTNEAEPLIGDVNADGQVIFRRTNPNGSTADFSKFRVGDNKSSDVALEPTVFLDQMSRYLNHLHELRRIGEGEDTVKLPGYALNLVRIPVSLNPGEETQTGHGAEVTISVEPHLGYELLPTTFENLVINDVLNEFTPPLTDFLNSPDVTHYDATILQNGVASLESAKIPWSDAGWWANPDGAVYKGFWTEFAKKLSAATKEDPGFAKYLGVPHEDDADENDAASGTSRWSFFKHAKEVGEERIRVERFREGLRTRLLQTNVRLGRAASRSSQLAYPLSMFSTILGQGLLFHVGWDAYRRVPNATRVPPASDKEVLTPTVVHFHDVRAYLHEETQQAYQLLRRPENLELWNLCTHNLVTAIRSHHRDEIASIREQFFAGIDREWVDLGLNPMATAPQLPEAEDRNEDGDDSNKSEGEGGETDALGDLIDYTPPVHYRPRDTVTAALAWVVLVHAALLNDRMVRDMNVTFDATATGIQVDDWRDFYAPTPSPEARLLFNEYVRARWPVRVFTIDPLTQDQNVGDRFNQRREFQLALAVAFATGEVGIDQMTRFARRLELDMESIALNRTVVGFSQGEDTFGWRFFPRVQTPPTPSNARVAFRELLIGGSTREEDLRHHRIEPGPRECIALVLKPAFVRQLVCDVRTDWFRLDKPRKTRLDLDDMVEMNEKIRGLREDASQCLEPVAGNRYRDSDARRLRRRLDHLSKESPLQTMPFETPVENHLAGFKVFVPNGYYDMSPQIFSWYGLPGVDTGADSTIFLIGENLRPYGLEVIVGNKRLKPYELTEEDDDDVVRDPDNKPVLLNGEPIRRKKAVTRKHVAVLSESVIELNIPAGAKTVKRRDKDGVVREFVAIHVATHHGVSQTLHVPAHTSQPPAKKEKPKASTSADEATSPSAASHATVQIQVAPQGDASQSVYGGGAATSASETPSGKGKTSADTETDVSYAFDWKSLKTNGKCTVTFEIDTDENVNGDDKLAFKDIDLDLGTSELILKATPQSLAPEDDLRKTLQLGDLTMAFWLRQLSAGKRRVASTAIGPIRVSVNGAPVSADVLKPLIEAALKSHLHPATRHIELEAYVRFTSDSLPVRKVGNTLKLKLERVEPEVQPDDADTEPETTADSSAT